MTTYRAVEIERKTSESVERAGDSETPDNCERAEPHENPCHDKRPRPIDPKRFRLRRAVRMFYDLQRLRIQAGGRTEPKAVGAEIQLDSADIAFMNRTSADLNRLESAALREIEVCLDAFRITPWLIGIRGLGPTMAGVILSEFDITIATTVSKLWAFAGLHVVDGHAAHPVKGKTLSYNKWLRMKLLGVLGVGFLRCGSEYKQTYDDYKHRLQSRVVTPCMECAGVGKAIFEGRKVTCPNCEGGSRPPPWGRSDAHRHQAAIRYMVKVFLKDLYVAWRTVEGLAVRAPYAEEKLGHSPHAPRQAEARDAACGGIL